MSWMGGLSIRFDDYLIVPSLSDRGRGEQRWPDCWIGRSRAEMHVL